MTVTTMKKMATISLMIAITDFNNVITNICNIGKCNNPVNYNYSSKS
jgi:hypothetical protein